MRRTLALIAFLALLSGGAEGALAQEATDDSDRIQSLVQPSIVYLETTFSAVVRDVNPNSPEIMFGGDPVEVGSRCTGFFVNPEGYVATAAHCILPDEAGNNPGETRRSIIDEAGLRALSEGVFEPGATEEGAVAYARDWFRIVGRIAVASAVAYPTDSTRVSSQETTAARRVGYRSFQDGDIGLLKFETSGVAMPGLELAEDEEVRSQTPIFAVGFPGSVDDVTDQDYNPTFSNGAIQRYGTREGRAVPVYQHGAEVSGGMSGGPVVDADGRVIGVTSFGRAGETASFNFASPVALLREVLGDKGVENDVGPVGRIYREGVEALYDENKDTALDRFGEVLQNYPGNPARSLASPLRLRAEELPDEGFPMWLLGLVVLGVLALAGGAILLRRRAAVPAFAGVPSSAASPPRSAATVAPPTYRAADTATGNGGPAVLVVGPRGETAVRHALEGEMLVGREAVDILLADEQVSRKHAQLTVKDDGTVELSDLGSANGTEVNGKRITGPVTLKHGDTITLGSTELKVELPKTRGAVPSGETVIGR